MESEGHFSGSCSAPSPAWFVQSSVQTSCKTSKLQEAGIQSSPSVTSPMDKSLHSPDPQGTWKLCARKTTPLSWSVKYCRNSWQIVACPLLMFPDDYISKKWVCSYLSQNDLGISFVNPRCCNSHKGMLHKREMQKTTDICLIYAKREIETRNRPPSSIWEASIYILIYTYGTNLVL